MIFPIFGFLDKAHVRLSQVEIEIWLAELKFEFKIDLILILSFLVVLIDAYFDNCTVICDPKNGVKMGEMGRKVSKTLCSACLPQKNLSDCCQILCARVVLLQSTFWVYPSSNSRSRHTISWVFQIENSGRTSTLADSDLQRPSATCHLQLFSAPPSGRFWWPHTPESQPDLSERGSTSMSWFLWNFEKPNTGHSNSASAAT